MPAGLLNNGWSFLGREGRERQGSRSKRGYLHSLTGHSGLPWLLSGKESTCNAEVTGNMGLIPGSGKSTGGRNGNPLQYSCLENPMDKGAWWATVHRVTTSQTRLKRLSTHTHLPGELKLTIMKCMSLLLIMPFC